VTTNRLREVDLERGMPTVRAALQQLSFELWRGRSLGCAAVKLIHGETLDHDGCFTIENVNKPSLPLDAFQEVTYICRGGEAEQYQPSFSIFGFRYAKLEGYEGSIHPGDFTAVALYSAMEETGDFHCSHPLINKLVENARWSQKGNFMDVPVDCPTRERNAWTGDAQIFVRTACTFMDGYAFYEKWLQDQTLEQFASGKVGITFPSTSSVHDPAALSEKLRRDNPLYALAGPTGDGSIGEDATGWGDAAVWLPYSVYLYYGDTQILQNQYETARKWLEFELHCAQDSNPLYVDRPYYKDGVGQYVFDTRFQYGEWNEAFGVQEKVRQHDAHRHDSVPQKTPQQLAEERQAFAKQVQGFLLMKQKAGDAVTATAYMARSARLVAEMARILGKEQEAAHYAALAEKIVAVYARYLIAQDGQIQQGHQAPYVRALAMELCGEKKQAVLKQLLHEIKANDDALNTGFLSTPFLLPVLADNGHAAVAYRILENEGLPGWLYPVKKGLTTIPESWGGVDLLEDSLNHYSYGAVCEFLFQYTTGIRPDAAQPGWKHFFLQPVPGGSLHSARATQKTPFGEIRSAWTQHVNGLHYTCTIPVNTTATLTLPDGVQHTLGSGSYTFEVESQKENLQ
jgi:alpha-L-rhamnosidase